MKSDPREKNIVTETDSAALGLPDMTTTYLWWTPSTVEPHRSYSRTILSDVLRERAACKGGEGQRIATQGGSSDCGARRRSTLADVGKQTAAQAAQPGSEEWYRASCGASCCAYADSRRRRPDDLKHARTLSKGGLTNPSRGS